MLRGYRSIILAFAGLALIGASPSKQGSTQSQSTQTGNAVSSKPVPANLAIPEQPVTPSPDKGCERGKDNRKSDLCAQWKAADAATDGATWSWWQLWIGVAGLILGAITMGAAIAAALYAKRAAIATEETVGIAKGAANDATNALAIAGRNADAAVKLADQAEKTSERQLQAYAHVESVVFHHGFGNSDDMHIALAIVNHGQTPAKVNRLRVVSTWQTTDAGDIILMDHDYIINVTSYKDLPVRMPLPLTEPGNTRLEGTLVVEGDIFYSDVFDADRQSSFVFTSGKERFSHFEDGHRLSYMADEMTTKVNK